LGAAGAMGRTPRRRVRSRAPRHAAARALLADPVRKARARCRRRHARDRSRCRVGRELSHRAGGKFRMSDMNIENARLVVPGLVPGILAAMLGWAQPALPQSPAYDLMLRNG